MMGRDRKEQMLNFVLPDTQGTIFGAPRKLGVSDRVKVPIE